MFLKAKLPIWVFIAVTAIGVATMILLIQYKSSVLNEMNLQSVEDAYWTKTIPQKDTLADWQVYRDDKFGYEIKYPKGYTIYKYIPPCGSSWDNVKGQNIIIWSDEFLQSHDISKNQIADFDIFINDPEDKCVEPHYSSPARDETKGYELIGSENITINGYKALKRNYIDTDIPPEGEAFNFSTWRFENNGTYYTLLYNNGVTIDPEKQTELFNKFLSTFKFIEPVDTSDWKTYRNDEYGFEFKYPSDWNSPSDITGYLPFWLNRSNVFKRSTTQSYPEPNFPIDALVHVDEIDNPENLSLQEIFDQDYQNCLKEENNEMGCPGSEDTSHWEKLTINNKEALRSGKRPMPEGLPSDSVYIILDKKLFIIEAIYYNLNYNDLDKIFDQILSTFKFIK